MVHMKKNKKLVILGDSAFAEIAYEYFTKDSEYEVIGFSVEADYITKNTLFGLPVVPFENIEESFDSADVEFFSALVYTQLNRLRTRLYNEAKIKGYKPASYISSRAFVWDNVVLGEHCFIFEDNTVQPFVRIEDNVILWSGNHIGHHSTIGENCFIASQVVVSGFCNIGKNTFIGVNATISNNVNIGSDNWLGIGVTITKDTDDGTLFKGVQSDVSKISTHKFFKVSID